MVFLSVGVLVESDMAKLLGYGNRKNKPSIKIIIVDIESNIPGFIICPTVVSLSAHDSVDESVNGGLSVIPLR